MACSLNIDVLDKSNNPILRIEGKPTAKIMLDLGKIVAEILFLFDSLPFFPIYKTALAVPASSTDRLVALVSVYLTPLYLFCLLAVLLQSTTLKMEAARFFIALFSNQLYSITSHTSVVLNKLFI